ncbi:hypothetical protein ABH994_005601 [Bradyrhizobium yuanmingense]
MTIRGERFASSIVAAAHASSPNLVGANEQVKGRRYRGPSRRNGRSLDSLNVWLRCGCRPNAATFGGSRCGKSQFPQRSNGSTSASRRWASYAMSARLPHQPVGGSRTARPGLSSRPSQRSFKNRDATCQRYVRGGRVQQARTCLASHPRIAGSHGIAQIATGQHDDDEPASPSIPALADSAPTARLAGLAHLHSPRALSSVEIRATTNVTNLRSK